MSARRRARTSHAASYPQYVAAETSTAAATTGLATRVGERRGVEHLNYLRELVTQGLDDLEDYYLAAATVERVRKGEPVYSAEQVRADLGLDD